jgi:hypothetical protein
VNKRALKFGLTASPFLSTKLLAVYGIAMTMVASSVLLLPSQAPTPNVHYTLFKIGQTSVDQSLVASGWKPVGYGCQAATPSQVSLGYGSNVCGYSYTTATHNLITTGGIDWLACVMVPRTTTHCLGVDKYIALSTDATAPAASDCGLGSNACTLTGETNGLQLTRTAGAYAHTNGSATYTLINTFTASGSFTGVQKSALFNEASSGAMIFENTFSSTNMASGDTLQVTWTITL